MKRALFIGRFQPFHKAHLSDVKLALKECDKIIIAIGSSQDVLKMVASIIGHGMMNLYKNIENI